MFSSHVRLAMLSRNSLAIVVVGLLAIAPLEAATSKPDPHSLDEVIKKVQEQQKKTTSLQADFRQEKALALLAKPEVSSGTFVYAKPNSVLWSYDAPKKVQMLISGGSLTTYYPDLKKAEKLDVKRFQDRIFRYMGASGAIDELAQYFDFTFVDNAANPNFVLDLNPKSRVIAKRVRHIRLEIDKKTYLTSKIEYVEGDGDSTKYEFTNIRINQPVPPARFVLNLPANVKVEQMKIQ